MEAKKIIPGTHCEVEYMVKESREPTEAERSSMPGVKRIITKADFVSVSICDGPPSTGPNLEWGDPTTELATRLPAGVKFEVRMNPKPPETRGAGE